MSNKEKKTVPFLKESCHKVVIKFCCKNSVTGITVYEGFTGIE
jgi:hypothetical protein